MPPINTANTVSLISDTGTTYYFHDGSGTRVSYNGSNTPWTAAATSCYELALNETAGPIWVPQPAPGQMIYGGGPPFVDGRQPIYRSYDNAIDQVGIQLYATTKNNAIFLLEQLRTILNTALFSRPCALAIRAGSNTDYFEIYHADVPESSLYLVEPDGKWRAAITWTHQPFGTPAALTTLLSGVTFTNTGTGANSNFRSLGAVTGDMASNTGNPMRISLALTASSVLQGTMYVAIVKSRTYVASNTAINTTSGGNGIQADVCAPFPPAATDAAGVAYRFIARVANPSANLQFRADSNMPASTGQWQTPGAVTGAYLDLGYIQIPANMRRAWVPVPGFVVRARSTNGAAATGSLTYMELVQYYTWMRAIGTFQGGIGESMELIGCDDAIAPYSRIIEPPFLTLASGGDTFIGNVDRRGRFPRAFSGAGLYLAWMLGNVHSTSATLTVTAKHAPLYQTVRGNA
jgi:hypothetical protein